MRFNIMIDGKQVPARYTGKTARLYREQFRKDIFETLADISAAFLPAVADVQNIQGMDIENPAVLAGVSLKAIGSKNLEELSWASVAAENPSTPLPEEWLDGIEDYQTFLYNATMVYHHMVGNVPLVEAEDKTEEDEDKKK